MKKPKLYTAVIASLFILSCGNEENKTTETTSEKKQNEIVNDVIEEVNTPTGFDDLLVELESNMGWESVTEEWKTRRETWLTDCYAAPDVTTLANLLLEFESMVEWSAVDKKWADVRSAWSNDVANAATEGELGDLLVIFESYILWDVVSPAWVDLREDWMTRCEAIE